MTRRLLESYGYTVLEAASGSEAINLWRSGGAEMDLVLTDIVMPDGVTGYELAEQLRGEKPALKVIFMTGYSCHATGKDTEFIRRTKSFFLQKPCSAVELARAVRECLDGQHD